MEKALVMEDTEALRNQLTGELEKDYTLLLGVDNPQGLERIDREVEEERARIQKTLQKALERGPEGLEPLIGECRAMRRVLDGLRRLAPLDVPVLLSGESGTGKELAARSLCALSGRAAGPFVTINCGAIPQPLLESELFGAEYRGSSGSIIPVPGKIERARQGTLYIDECEKLPLQAQVKLLRFLREGTLQRAGGTEPIELDTRVVCATTMDTAHAVRDGLLREDLYLKVGVLTLRLPPLRDRADDIMLLADLFLKKSAKTCHRNVRGFTSASVAVMKVYSWPGNIPELEHRVQRGVLLADAQLLKPEALGFDNDEPVPEGALPVEKLTLKEARDRVEKDVIAVAMDSSRGNMAKAAQLLGVSRPTLYDLLKKHGIHHSSASVGRPRNRATTADAVRLR